VTEIVGKNSAFTVHRRRFLKAATAAAGSALLPEVAWPASPSDSYDLRNDNNKNYITAVKDQEDPLPCNACTAFAVAAAVEGTYNKKCQRTGNPATLGPNLDEMELFLRAPDPNDPNDVASGGCGTSHWWPKHALARCKSKGIKVEGSSPEQFYKVSPKSLLSESSSLNPKQNLDKTQGDMKDWIRNTGPVVAVIVQYEDLYAWGRVWSEQHPNTLNPNVYAPGTTLSVCTPCATMASAPTTRTSPAPHKRPRVPIVGGHVVAIVGFDEAKKCWICKNSWGSDWNGDGYVLIEQGRSSGQGPIGIAGCYIDLIDVWGVEFGNPACT